MAAAETASAVTSSDRWSQLSTDLLNLILKRLVLVDYIRFGAVCTAWNSVAMAKLFRPARQIPWLMYPAADEDGEGGCDTRTFLDVSTGRTYRMHLPELYGRHCIGTSTDGGWVVYIAEDLELQILNVMTRERLPLPPLSTLWNARINRDQEGRVVECFIRFLNPSYPNFEPVTIEKMFRCFFGRAAVSPLGVVAFIHEGYVSVARTGDEAWTMLEPRFQVQDVMFHGVRLYAVNGWGAVVSWVLNDACSFSWSEAKTLLEPTMDAAMLPWKYWVVLPGLSDTADQVFQVWRNVELAFDDNGYLSVPYRYGTVSVKVFKVDLAKGTRIEVKDLGGYSFFLGHNYPFVLSAQEFPQLRKDCIYFTDDNLELMFLDVEDIYDTQHSDRDMGIFNLEDGRWEPLPLPGPIVNFPAPTWVSPSPF